MIIRVRLLSHPDKYVGRDCTTYAFACDEDRRTREDNWYREESFRDAHWFVPDHQANTWTKPSNIKRTLSTASRGHKWVQTTWTAYEVVHLDTGKVEPLDVFLLKYRGKHPDPTVGETARWEFLKERVNGRPKVPFAIAEAQRLIPDGNCPAQRQDSTNEQVATILELARRAGCYDAHDHLKRLFDNAPSTKKEATQQRLKLKYPRKGRCPRPADGPRTVEAFKGQVLHFAPGNDACTHCDHCNEHIEAHDWGDPKQGAKP